MNVMCVIYWPLTEPSIKRCTSVNKRKNSGRWTLENNITRCPDGLGQLETGCRIENQLQTKGFAALSDPRLSNPAKMRKKCCYGQKNLSQYRSLSLSPTHLSHTTNMTLSRIKCEIYIFIKKCVRSFIDVRKLCLIMFPLVFVLRLYNNLETEIKQLIINECSKNEYKTWDDRVEKMIHWLLCKELRFDQAYKCYMQKKQNSF